MSEDQEDGPLPDPADRGPVDWDALEREAGSRVDRDWLTWLRAIGDIPGVPPPDGAGAVTAGPADTTLPPLNPELNATLPRWGKFVLVQNVGDGGFGSVYRAWDPDLEREVAIKVLHRRIESSSLRRKVLEEGRLLARVRHANVVHVLGVEVHDDQMALCMDFVHGDTLEDVVKREGPLSAPDAAQIGLALADALAAVHQAGFIHRDVKSRNVMRERGGRIVLMDFGAGRHVDDLRVPGRVSNVGTPLYMAPEVLAGGPASPASDIYSLGVLLHFLVTGSYPVEGRSADDLRRAHQAGMRRPLVVARPDLPATYVRIVERALAADPGQRYPDAAALADVLGRAYGSGARLRTPRERAQAIGTGVIGGVLMATSVGMVTSLEYNVGLGIGSFSTDPPLTWLWVGLRSSVGAAFSLLLALFCGTLVMGMHRMLLTLSVPARRADAWTRAALLRGAHALHLDDAETRSGLLLLLSAALLVWAWTLFQPMLGNLLLDGTLWSAPAEKLRLLAPENRPYHYFYRKVFTAVFLASGTAWFVAWRFGPRTPAPFYRATLAGLAAVFFLAMFSLGLPFRVLYLSEADIVRYQGVECYVTGERPDAALIFCPTLTPRNRLASRRDGSIAATGRRGSIFAQFGNQTVTAAGR